jgi:hypothetical protein
VSWFFARSPVGAAHLAVAAALAVRDVMVRGVAEDVVARLSTGT